MFKATGMQMCVSRLMMPAVPQSLESGITVKLNTGIRNCSGLYRNLQFVLSLPESGISVGPNPICVLKHEPGHSLI